MWITPQAHHAEQTTRNTSQILPDVPLDGLDTGLAPLDAVLGPLRPGSLVMAAGRFACQRALLDSIAVHHIIDSPVDVRVIADWEGQQTYDKLLANASGVAQHKIGNLKTADPSPEEQAALAKAEARLARHDNLNILGAEVHFYQPDTLIEAITTLGTYPRPSGQVGPRLVVMHADLKTCFSHDASPARVGDFMIRLREAVRKANAIFLFNASLTDPLPGYAADAKSVPAPEVDDIWMNEILLGQVDTLLMAHRPHCPVSLGRDPTDGGEPFNVRVYHYRSQHPDCLENADCKAILSLSPRNNRVGAPVHSA